MMWGVARRLSPARLVLDPIDDTTTRLVVRDRAAWRRRDWLFKVLIYEPLHAYMEVGLLTGIRQRAEAVPAATA